MQSWSKIKDDVLWHHNPTIFNPSVQIHSNKSTLKLLSEMKVLLSLMLSLPRESESFVLLLNFENDDSGLAVKMLFR